MNRKKTDYEIISESFESELDKPVFDAIAELGAFELFTEFVANTLSVKERREFNKQGKKNIREKREELLAKVDKKRFLAVERRLKLEEKRRKDAFGTT